MRPFGRRREQGKWDEPTTAAGGSRGYRSGLVLRVVRVVEGTFPHDYVICAAHSGALMKFFLLMEMREDSLVFRKDALLELSLVWDGRQRLYRLDEQRIVER